MRRVLLALVLLTGMAAVPEPDGFRLDNYNAAVPDTLRGGRVLHTQALEAFLPEAHPVLIDVLPAQRRPEGMAPAAPWLPLAHRNIPGSIWLPDVGRGDISLTLKQFFVGKLKALTGGKLDHPLVFYCRAQCWMSWNAARRAVLLGYSQVTWYPDGVEGWQAAGGKLEAATPEMP